MTPRSPHPVRQPDEDEPGVQRPPHEGSVTTASDPALQQAAEQLLRVPPQRLPSATPDALRSTVALHVAAARSGRGLAAPAPPTAGRLDD